eukprot:jgi/Picsp_1/2730/NSC_00958-R1_hypothetical protein COCSUDRAFT_59149 [Coccomyxa subellipsoidea C-169]
MKDHSFEFQRKEFVMAQTGSEIVGSQGVRERVLEEKDLGCCEKNNIKEKKRKHDVVVKHDLGTTSGEEDEEANGGKKRCKVGLAQALLQGSGCSEYVKYLKPSYWVSKVEKLALGVPKMLGSLWGSSSPGIGCPDEGKIAYEEIDCCLDDGGVYEDVPDPGFVDRYKKDIQAVENLLCIKTASKPQLSMAKDIDIVSRSQLKQQLRDRVNRKRPVIRQRRLDQTNDEACNMHMSTRGSKILDMAFLKATRDKNTQANTRIQYFEIQPSSPQISEHVPDTSSDDNANEEQDAGNEYQQESPPSLLLSPETDDGDDEVSLADMLQQSDEMKKQDHTSLEPDLDITFGQSSYFDGFLGNASPGEISVDNLGEQPSPLVHMEVGYQVVENHMAELSPDDTLIASSDAAQQCTSSVLDKKLPHLSGSKDPGPSNEHQDDIACPTTGESTPLARLREAVINANLADEWRKGENWARLDISGVELDPMVVDYSAAKTDVIQLLQREKGCDALQAYLDQIESEWKHLKQIRQKYSSEGQQLEPDAPKSILKRTPTRGVNLASPRAEAGTLRWAEENVEHQYTEEDLYTWDDDSGAVLPQTTRGLRMLLASSALQTNNKNGVMDLSEKPRMQSQRISARSRARIGGGKSKGQRLLAALHQAATESTSMGQQVGMNNSTEDAHILPLKTLSTSLT